MRIVRVPLAIDAKITFPVGPLNLPIRTIVLLLAALFPALVLLNDLSGVYKWLGPMLVLFFAAMLAVPEREGLWVGTWCFFRLTERFLVRTIHKGKLARARVKKVGSGILVGKAHAPLAVPPPFGRVVKVPRLAKMTAGLFERKPGGWCGIVELQGPDPVPQSEAYAAWCDQVIDWMQAVEVPCQLLARSIHYDRSVVEQAYESHSIVTGIRLGELERRLAGDVAARTMVIKHYVIFMPRLAAKDGIPTSRRFATMGDASDTAADMAEQALHAAVRLAGSFGLEVEVPDGDEVSALVRESILAAREATACGELIAVGNSFRMYATVTALPPKIPSGSMVMAMMRARVKGSVSVHIIPVDMTVARTKLNRMRMAYKYSSQTSNSVDAQMMAQDTEALLAAFAGRQAAAVRVGVLTEVEASSPEECKEGMERMLATISSEGMRPTAVTTPGFVAAAACAPGGIPLKRSLLLTTDRVASCLLPVVGTPFGDPEQPLVGINAATGSPIYLDVFRRPNHNAVIVGTSGAGKSVACKTLLLRHYAQGALCIAIDPDSEYRQVIQVMGGSYVEVGEASLNALAAPPETSPDEAAGLVIPILSVMGGEEVGYKDGRPVRRLNDADKAWLHEEVAQFYADWRSRYWASEPILSDLIEYLERVSIPRCTSARMKDRCRDIMLRLRGYTQGVRARIFNQPTSFSLEGPAIGIGLRELAVQFRADMTAAMAVVLTKTLAMLSRREGRLVILVDEAHRVISDPDSGQVLDQLVRQARKYGAGVWMASQSIDDFVRTELGRILAATASTKLVLGIEQTVAEGAQEVFGLSDQEMGALTPRYIPGRGVLISGAERAIVDVYPGQHLMPLINTSLPMVRQEAS
jgi:hypothetical protein